MGADVAARTCPCGIWGHLGSGDAPGGCWDLMLGILGELPPLERPAAPVTPFKAVAAVPGAFHGAAPGCWNSDPAALGNPRWKSRIVLFPCQFPTGIAPPSTPGCPRSSHGGCRVNIPKKSQHSFPSPGLPWALPDNSRLEKQDLVPSLLGQGVPTTPNPGIPRNSEFKPHLSPKKSLKSLDFNVPRIQPWEPGWFPPSLKREEPKTTNICHNPFSVPSPLPSQGIP